MLCCGLGLAHISCIKGFCSPLLRHGRRTFLRYASGEIITIFCSRPVLSGLCFRPLSCTILMLVSGCSAVLEQPDASGCGDQPHRHVSIRRAACVTYRTFPLRFSLAGRRRRASLSPARAHVKLPVQFPCERLVILSSHLAN